jgi:hypothetical protein
MWCFGVIERRKREARKLIVPDRIYETLQYIIKENCERYSTIHTYDFPSFLRLNYYRNYPFKHKRFLLAQENNIRRALRG